MIVSPQTVAAALLGDPIYDGSGGRLTPASLAEVRAAIARAGAQQKRVFVVLLPPGTDLRGYHLVAALLKLDSERDVIVLSDGQRLEANGWYIPSRAIATVLRGAAPVLANAPGKGLAQVIDRLLATAGGLSTDVDPGDAVPPVLSSPPSPPSPPRRPSWWPYGEAGLAAGALGLGLLLVIRRRNARAGEARAALTAAVGSAERRYADLMLAAEELGAGAGEELQRSAVALKARLDELASAARGAATADRVTLGKIAQLEDEIVALRSAVLRKQG